MMKAVSKSASKEPSERASMTPMKPLGDLAGLLDDVRARCPAFAEAFGAHFLRLIEQHKDIRCLIPGFDGAISSSEWKDALWARYCTEAPRRRGSSG
jgi:hypothetical protein